MKDLRKLNIRKVTGTVVSGMTFYEVNGLKFSRKSDAQKYKGSVVKRELQERQRMRK